MLKNKMIKKASMGLLVCALALGIGFTQKPIQASACAVRYNGNIISYTNFDNSSVLSTSNGGRWNDANRSVFI